MINFTPDRWDQIREAYSAWWEDRLERPLLAGVIGTPYTSKSGVPLLSQASCADFRWTPEELIDRIDEDLSHITYLGDAYPYVCFDCFGPGVLAAFLGATLDNSTGRVWFRSPGNPELKDLHFEFDPHNLWIQRIDALYRAGNRKWQGLVQMSMPDLGGILDVLASFRGTENLLMDLYDEPEEVRRVSRELVDCWFQAYEHFNETLQPFSPGYTDWSSIWSPVPSYIHQCDFCYMIGPDMFRDFVFDDLTQQCRRVSNAIYHLDGPGELPHVDQILSIPEVKVMQWVPGEGNPGPVNWIDLYRKFRKAGKKIQILGDMEEFHAVTDQIGAAGSFCRLWPASEEQFRRFQESFQ